MRILIALSAAPDWQPGTSLEVEGLIKTYYLFRDAGVDVVVSALGGGSVDEPPASKADANDASRAELVRRFKSDRAARDVMNDLVDLVSVCAADFAGALCLGAPTGNGSDGVGNRAGLLVAELLAAQKPVAVVADTLDDFPGMPARGVLILCGANEGLRTVAHALLGAIGSVRP